MNTGLVIKTSIVKVIKECGNEERLKNVSVLKRRRKIERSHSGWGRLP